MKYLRYTLVPLLIIQALPLCGGQSQASLAPTPPMGWNSFDSYGVYLHEEAAYANVEAMAEKLKPRPDRGS